MPAVGSDGLLGLLPCATRFAMTNINRSNRCLISILSSHGVSIPLPVARIDRTPRSARTSHAAITAGVWRGQNCVILRNLC